MGVASSSNSANVASSIANSVKNSTVISKTAIQDSVNNINMYNCKVKTPNGKVTFQIQQSAYQRNQQSIDVSADTSLKNTASQSAVQSATSKLGSLGIGAANASNSINMMANISNNIVNAVTSNQRSVQSASNNINCDNTEITAAGDITFSIRSSQQLYNDFVFSNKAITDVTNTITQTVKQTASATVEGPAAALLAAAVLVVAIGWAIGNVETGGMASEIGPLIFALVTITIVILIFCAWYFSWWPFFNKLIPCTPSVPKGGIGVPGDRCETCVVENTDPQEVGVDAPPIKYIFPIFNTAPPAGTPKIDTSKFTDFESLASIVGSDPQLKDIHPPPQVSTSLWDLAISACSLPGGKLGPSKEDPNAGIYTAGTMNNGGYNIETLINSSNEISLFNGMLTKFYNTDPTDPILKALCEIILGKGTYASQKKPIPPLLLDPSGTLPSTVPNGTVTKPTSPTYIKIPDQFMWSTDGLGTNTGPVGATNQSTDVVTGSCTPRTFYWNGSESNCYNADSTTTGNQCPSWIGNWLGNDSKNNKCYVAGTWSWKNGSTVKAGFGTNVENGAIAQSNLPGFGEWLFATAEILATDPSVTSRARQLAPAKYIAQNTLCAFVRTMLTHIINTSNAGGNATGQSKFMQIPIPNNAMLTGIPGQVTPELIVIKIEVLMGGYILTEKNPNPNAAQAQTLWKSIVGTKASGAAPQPGQLTIPATIADYMKNNVQYYTPDTYTNYNYTCTLIGPGKMKLVQGICHNKNWAIQNFMLKTGNYIFLFIILVALAYLAHILF